jgi:hypothetical protein
LGELTNLLEKYVKITNSEKNIKNKSYFQKTKSIIINRWRGVPKNLNEIEGRVPFVYWLGEDLWRQLFDINIERMYKEPLYYLEIWLKTKIFYFENFDDCNVYENLIPIWPGEGFEPALFGCRRKFSPVEEPAIDPTYILIKNYEDLKKMKLPDFYNSFETTLAIKFYKEISNIVNGYGVEAGFFDWHIGPTSLCNYLRGFENLSLDYILNKEFVNELMNFVISARMKWSIARDSFLNTKRDSGGILSNDDVSVPNVSPKIYGELIFPYELKLHEFYGGFNYYHNCGPIDPFLEKIKEFESIDLFHSGPYSDYRKVGEAFGKKSAIELYLKKINILNELNIKESLSEIKNTYSDIGVKAYYVRTTTYSTPGLSINENIEKIRNFCTISNKILLGI